MRLEKISVEEVVTVGVRSKGGGIQVAAVGGVESEDWGRGRRGKNRRVCR